MGKYKKIIYGLCGAAVMSIMFAISGVTVSAGSTKEITGTSRYDYAYKVLEESNAARVKEGKKALTMDKDLLEAAMIRAAECAVSFTHNRPNGDDCFTLHEKIYAENLAMGQTSPSEVVTDWLASSGHRTNLLNGDYKSIGVGVFEYDGKLYWVELFGKVKADEIKEPATGETTYHVALTKSEKSVIYSGAGVTSSDSDKDSTEDASNDNKDGSEDGTDDAKVDSLASKVAGVKIIAGKKKLTIKWKKKSDVTGYQVQISNKKSYSSVTTYTLPSSRNKLVIKKFFGKRLKSKKKYYIRVRAYREIEDDTGATAKYCKWKKLTKKVK